MPCSRKFVGTPAKIDFLKKQVEIFKGAKYKNDKWCVRSPKKAKKNPTKNKQTNKSTLT